MNAIPIRRCSIKKYLTKSKDKQAGYEQADTSFLRYLPLLFLSRYAKMNTTLTSEVAL